MLLRCESIDSLMSQSGQSHRTKQAAASPDVRFTSNSDQAGASQRSDALCQNRTYAPQQTISLFYHLVGAGEQRGWQREAERVGCFQVDEEFKLDRLINRDVARFRPLENLIHVVGHAPE